MDSIDYGVCRLALVPVRKAPGDSAEQVSQLLFGDHYEAKEVTPDKRWLLITIITDQCQGWIDARQHHTITPEYLEQIKNADFKITLDIVTAILYKKSPLHIVLGSIVPISSSELFKIEEQLLFNGEAKSLSQRRDFEFVKLIASRYLNSPYQWGGKSPFGIDADGLTQMVFKISGYTLARYAFQQSVQGKKVKSFADAKPGDLALFSDKKENIVHAGIVLEDDRIVHAYGKVRIDHLTDEGILNVETKIYTHQLAGLRRILTST